MALGFMRRHKRWLYVFLWVVVAAFIIAYIPALTGMGINDRGAGATLVEVGTLPITVAEYQKAYLRQREYFQSLYQRPLDNEMVKRLGLEEQTLQALIDDRVMQLEARRLGISVDDETVRQRLATSPEFQVDGRFMGGDEIRRRLEMRGISVADFEQDLRKSILRERLSSLITDGVMVSAREAEEEYRRRNEQVKAEYVRVADAPGLTVTDDEVKAKFEAGKERYAYPERRTVEYLLLDVPRLQSRVTVTEAEEREYYEAHQDEFKQDEQVCATHILVKVKVTPEATEGHADEEAKKLAQSALDQARAGGDFAALAKKMSEDQGSAPQGGDLGCFPRGRMVPEFENAAFALKPGEISDLVKTQYGYHVIRLTSRREETVPALAQVKDRIHQTLTGQRVRALMDEQVQGLADVLRHGKSLEDAARERGFLRQISKPLARGETTQPLASPALVARAFELKKGETEPEPFQVPGGYAFIALAEIQAPRPAKLEEVKDRVRTDLLQDKTQAASRETAAELKRRAETSGLEKAAASLQLVRKETPNLVARGQPMGDLGTSPALDEAAFALPEGTLSDPVRIPGGWALVRVTEKKAVDPAAFEKEKPALIASLRQERKEELFRAFMQEARKRVTVQRNADAFKRVMAS
jgi:peptidyl-prolyl cis-trans isomerase D